MIWLKSCLERIDRLVEEGTPSSLTHAALECRLAIEQICYDRLRNAHSYISHKDIRKWQPAQVVKTLLLEVDQNIATTATLSISTEPAEPPGRGDLTAADFANYEYVEIGTQVGFDPAELAKHWNALSSFLHVRLPKTAEDDVQTYGDTDKLRRTVNKARSEIQRICQGTLIMSGGEETVQFLCFCGTTNRRKSGLLKDRQTIHCYNPECQESWTVECSGGEVTFKARLIEIACRFCKAENSLLHSPLLNIPREAFALPLIA